MKKLCSAVLTAVMLTQGFGAVSFADTTDQTTTKVIYQNSFSDYADNAAYTQPRGFVKAIADHEGTRNDASYTRFRPWQEEDGDTSVLNGNYTPQGNDTSYLYNRNGAFDVIPFGEVINSGKLHISMDFMRPDKQFDPNSGQYTDNYVTGGRFMVTLFNTDTNDYTTPAGKVYKASGTDVNKFYATDATATEFRNMSDAGTHMSSLVGFMASCPNGVTEYTSVTAKFSGIYGSVGTQGEGESFDNWNKIKWNVNRWHKLDIIVDLDNKETSSDGKWEGRKVYTYVDGVLAPGDASTAELVAHNVSGFKGIGVYNEHYSQPGFRYDNVYVSHYTNIEDSVKLLDAETDMSDKKVSVAFTEYLNKTPDASDFTVTNDKGAAVKGYSVSGDGRKATFDFSNATGVPKNGRLIIKANDTLKGNISNLSVGGQVEIKVAGTEVLYQNTFSHTWWEEEGQTWNDTTPAFDGMVLGNADYTGKATNHFYTNLKQYSEEDGDKSAIMWRGNNSGANAGAYVVNRNGAFDVIPFNKVINSGKIYFSTDFWVPNEYAYDWNNKRYYNDSDLTPITDDMTDEQKKAAENANAQLKIQGTIGLTLFNTGTQEYVDNMKETYGGTYHDGNQNNVTVNYGATGEDLNNFIAMDTAASKMQDSTTPLPVHQSEMFQIGADQNKISGCSGPMRGINRRAATITGANEAWPTYDNTTPKWHKLEVIVDCGTTVTSDNGLFEGNPVKAYVDGVLVNENASTAKLISEKVSGYKGIGIYRRGWARAGFRFDNMYVSHYETEKQDSVKLLDAENDFSDKKVSVAFTEYLNKAPEASDFDVKTNVGTPIEGYIVSGDARKATFDFTNATKLPIDGKVIITPKNTLTGKISGLGISGSMEIPFGFSGTNVFEKQDEDGTWFAATTVAADDKVRAHINVTNGYSDTKNMVYIIAKYTKDDDGSLILSEIIKSESVECKAKESKDLMTDIVNPDSSAVYKAFVWNADGYRPFMESAIIQ
mgnify:CR=1 FL=1